NFTINLAEEGYSSDDMATQAEPEPVMA
ncbi:hypothetical protein A2U01_0092586, partial [Trifolium medium]|nr:hypothetical protein [Trifolium medium]